MAARKIVVVGNPILRQKIFPSQIPETSKLAHVIADLKDTIRLLGPECTGLAANQIGEKERICVVRIGKSTLEVLINPMFNARFGGRVPSVESCYSIPGYEAIIPRQRAVHVWYQDINGKSHFIQTHNLSYAIRLQHEIDHLDGVLIKDYVENENERQGGLLITSYDPKSVTAQAYISQQIIFSEEASAYLN